MLHRRGRFQVFCMLAALLGAGVPAFGAASPYAKVLAAKSATFAGKPLKTGQLIESDGTVEAASGGSARIRMLASDTELIVTSSSKLELSAPKADGGQELSLLAGLARAVIGAAERKSEKGEKPFFRVRTGSAVMGVRGTDFMTVASPLLGETEVVVFDGEVEMQSLLDKGDKKSIPKGYWGGVGGRFGGKIGDLIKLPSDALAHFDRISK